MASFIQLNQEDGGLVLINVDQISAILQPIGKNGITRLLLAGVDKAYFVKESYDEVLNRLVKVLDARLI